MATKDIASIWSAELDIGTNNGEHWLSACPLTTIEAALNNASNVPIHGNVTKVLLFVGASMQSSAGSLTNVYFRYGFGGTSSISKELVSRTKVLGGANASNVNNYPENGYDITSFLTQKEAPNIKLTRDYGQYLAFCFDTTNWTGKKQYYIKWVTLKVTYSDGSHSYTTEISRTPSTCCTKGSVTKQCSCGGTQTTELALDPNNHSGGTEVRGAYAATCTATGYTGDTYCKGCNTKISSGSTIAKDPNNHSGSQTTIPAVAPTCTATGYTEGKKWSCCNAIITAQQTVPAKGHTAGATVTENRVEATCTTDGSYDEVTYCTVCGAEISRTKVTIPQKGHSYTTETFDPTETEAGFTRYTCSVCGHSYDADFKCRLTIVTENGTVSGVVDGGLYLRGTKAGFTAIPDEGYTFKSATVHYPDGSTVLFTNNTGILTFTNNITFVVKFKPILPVFTSMQLIYQNKQISADNKVPVGEYFRIVVGVESYD